MRCAYKYPPSSAVWKNTMHVFQTAGVPPSNGRTIFEKIGWMANSRAAFRKIAAVNTAATSRDRGLATRDSAGVDTRHRKDVNRERAERRDASGTLGARERPASKRRELPDSAKCRRARNPE